MEEHRHQRLQLQLQQRVVFHLEQHQRHRLLRLNPRRQLLLPVDLHLMPRLQQQRLQLQIQQQVVFHLEVVYRLRLLEQGQMIMRQLLQ